ncbi:MAG: chromosomal replication initiator protein DnaA [Muribaculaceae bacterium]|nr:chromosomal replication initiator protein DnaA [Muribaculaceae bacterium]
MENDHKILWQNCLKVISDSIASPEIFDVWFRGTESIGFKDGKVTLSVPSEYFVTQYEHRFYNVMRSAFRKVYGSGVKIEYTYNVVGNDPTTAVTMESSAPSASVNNPISKQTARPANPLKDGVVYEEIDSQLNPVYNFENYCIGNSNKLPFTIAEFIGNNPKKTDFNPFFLYGSTGVGKTHLIQAIGIRVKERMPNARVLYITSRIFENQYGTAVREKRINDFVNFYQSIDVLLIDDIQELSGKTGTQNAFFPIFNYLHQKGRLLVMTSDRPPVDLDGFMDRLLSRFKWGVTEVLPGPDRELRKQILRQKSAKNGLALSEEVIDVIAGHVTDSVRELEGVVMSLITRATLLNLPITPELAKVVMQSAVKIQKRKINFDMIVEATASHYNLDADVIFSRSRVRDISDARQVIMYLASKLTDLSSTSIGYKLSRTHVTVLHGIKTVENRMGVEPVFQESIEAIEKSLRS